MAATGWSKPAGSPAAVDIQFSSVTILSGQSLSPAVDLSKLTLVGIKLPAAWTAAGLSFQGSLDGTNFGDLYDSSGTEIVIAAFPASGYAVVDTGRFFGVRFLKFRSGTTGSPVAQGADRVIQFGGRMM